jgi:hypothetical protein
VQASSNGRGSSQSWGDPGRVGGRAQDEWPWTASIDDPGAPGAYSQWGVMLARPGARDPAPRRDSGGPVQQLCHSRRSRTPLLLPVMSVVRRSIWVMGGMDPPIDPSGMPCEQPCGNALVTVLERGQSAERGGSAVRICRACPYACEMPCALSYDYETFFDQLRSIIKCQLHACAYSK